MNCEDYTCEAVGCSSHGVCTISENGSYVCVCNVGYYGEFCGLRQVCLVSGDCENGGTCETLGDGSSRCVCEPGYNDTYCEEAFGCRSEVGACQNGGVCNPSTSDPTDVECYCTRDYTGPTCAEPLGDGISVVTAIVVPVVVLSTALFLFLLASAHARRTGNRDANNLVVVKVVLALFDLMTDAVFVYAAWVDHDTLGSGRLVNGIPSISVPAQYHPFDVVSFAAIGEDGNARSRGVCMVHVGIA